MGCCRKTSPEEGDQPETRRPSGKFFSVLFLWERIIVRVSAK